MIIYNDAQISNTKIYKVGAGNLNYTGNTGYSSVFPNGYGSSTLMGISGFYSQSTEHYLWYHLTFGTLLNGSYGLIMPAPTISLGQSVAYYTVSYFYIEKASCPNATYILDTSGATPVCTMNCIDVNCLICVPSTTCQKCNYLANYYLLANNTCAICNTVNMFINISDSNYPCTLCNLIGCTTCTNLT